MVSVRKRDCHLGDRGGLPRGTVGDTSDTPSVYVPAGAVQIYNLDRHSGVYGYLCTGPWRRTVTIPSVTEGGTTTPVGTLFGEIISGHITWR